MDGGDLTAEQIDELGCALIEIRASLEKVRMSLGVSPEETEQALRRARHLVDPGPGIDPTAPDASRARSASSAYEERWKKARTAP